MNKLTAEAARQELTKLKAWENDGVLTLKEERYLQALEIALHILEQQERVCQKCRGTGEMDSGGTQPWGEQILVECDCQFEQQERGDGWISCSEQMPVQYQSNRYVPLTLLLNERTVAQGGFDDGHFWVDGVVMNNVTRWQPMPTPPTDTNQNGEQ